MTFLERLQAAQLPVIYADETGALETGATTPEQWQQIQDIILEHFRPIEYTELLQHRIDKQAVKNAYTIMITRLEQIQAATSPTNAQIVQAVKDEALYIERIIKLLKTILT